MRRTRQKDIAAALGLERSTVSKALKGDPAVAAATRERVREKARELGFQPDPMLSALAQYRNRNPVAHRATIAWICNYPKSTDMSLYAGHADYLAGASHRCRELGYHLESIWIDGKRTTLKGLPGMLAARGIKAVIFAPQAGTAVRIAFPMESVCALTIGYSLIEPKMDVITNDHFTTMAEILERLGSEGYRRIGCYLWETDNERMGRRARSAFQAFSQEFPCRIHTYRKFTAQAFSRWITRNKLDAVVIRDAEQARVVSSLNHRTGREIRCVGYAIDHRETTLSGMSHNNFQIGVRAAEWISSKLERGQFGAPKVPQRLLIAGQWLENT